MWKSLTTGFRSATGTALEETNAENAGKNHAFEDDVDEEDEVASKVEYSEAQLLPCESEKKHILQMFYTMRKDSFFCDVAFVCNGVLFRAHRVVVSSWSRWLRALLCESPDEEVVSLDFFDATAFGAALDYMYGVPLTITVENADHVLKVVRRLEMQKLEQQCWRYLMTVIDPATNAEILHELADRYDCPPLKLAAWRILQEKMPANGASLATSRLLKKGKEGMQAKVGFTGLTGPGEPWFNTSIGLNSSSTVLAGEDGGRLNVRSSYSDVDGEVVDEEEDELRRAKRFMPSVFSELKEADDDDETEGEDPLDDEYGSEDGDSEYRARRNKFGWDITNYKDPTELDTTASAAEIVQAWAFRLKEIYDQCNPTNALDYEDEDNFRIAPGSPNVRLTTYQRNIRANNSSSRDKRSALLGDLDEESASSPPPRPAADPFFKLVPSSSSIGGGGGGNAGVMPGGGVSVASVGQGNAPSPSPRRPPAPTAANTVAPGAAPSPKAGAGGGGGGGGYNKWPPSASHKSIDWREEMKRFYVAIGLPEKIAGINTILSTWAGKEEQMLASLMEKYRSSIPPQMNSHLEQLLAQLETHTESSFVRGPSITNNAPPPPAASPRSPPRNARRNKF